MSICRLGSRVKNRVAFLGLASSSSKSRTHTHTHTQNPTTILSLNGGLPSILLSPEGSLPTKMHFSLPGTSLLEASSKPVCPLAATQD